MESALRKRPPIEVATCQFGTAVEANATRSFLFIFNLLKLNLFGLCRLSIIFGGELKHLSTRFQVAI